MLKIILIPFVVSGSGTLVEDDRTGRDMDRTMVAMQVAPEKVVSGNLAAAPELQATNVEIGTVTNAGWFKFIDQHPSLWGKLFPYDHFGTGEHFVIFSTADDSRNVRHYLQHFARMVPGSVTRFGPRLSTKQLREAAEAPRPNGVPVERPVVEAVTLTQEAVPAMLPKFRSAGIRGLSLEQSNQDGIFRIYGVTEYAVMVTDICRTARAAGQSGILDIRTKAQIEKDTAWFKQAHDMSFNLNIRAREDLYSPIAKLTREAYRNTAPLLDAAGIRHIQRLDGEDRRVYVQLKDADVAFAILSAHSKTSRNGVLWLNTYR